MDLIQIDGQEYRYPMLPLNVRIFERIVFFLC